MTSSLKTIFPWIYSLFALYLRYTLGMIFWLSGQSKLDGWKITDGARWLFENEFKLPLLPPEIAVVLATIGEHVFPLMLFLGLGARFGAMGLLGMTLVIEIFVYPEEYILHSQWAAMALILIISGAGKFSIDYFIFLRTKQTLWQKIRCISLRSNTNSQKIHKP